MAQATANNNVQANPATQTNQRRPQNLRNNATNDAQNNRPNPTETRNNQARAVAESQRKQKVNEVVQRSNPVAVQTQRGQNVNKLV